MRWIRENYVPLTLGTVITLKNTLRVLPSQKAFDINITLVCLIRGEVITYLKEKKTLVKPLH